MADPTNLVTSLGPNVFQFTQDNSDFLIMPDPKNIDEKTTSSLRKLLENMRIFSLKPSPPPITQKFNPTINVEVNGSGSLKRKVAIFIAGAFIGIAFRQYASLAASTLGNFILNQFNLNFAQRTQKVIEYISSLNPFATAPSENHIVENIPSFFFDPTNLGNTNTSYPFAPLASRSY